MRYQSNLTCRDLTPAFRHTFTDTGALGHDVLHDKDFDRHCGYISHDEAAILAAIAREVGGVWVEIGSHTGWSASHIILGASCVACIDPEFRHEDFRARTWENLMASRPAGRVKLFVGTSAEFFAETSATFSGAFIDGNHSSPAPMNDAQMVYERLTDLAVVVFHDFVGAPVQDGVSWLIDQGMKFRIYNTQQMMAACWRGNIDMPVHVPDPAIDWDEIRGRCSGFDFSGEA